MNHRSYKNKNDPRIVHLERFYFRLSSRVSLYSVSTVFAFIAAAILKEIEDIDLLSGYTETDPIPA